MNPINHKDIKIPVNYVLVQPNEEMEKYHLNGKETNIYVGRSFMKYIDEHDSLDFETKETVDTYAHHWPITGKVITLPGRLEFNGFGIKRRRDGISDEALSPDDMKQLHALSRVSLSVFSPLEISEGDTVIFDYIMNIRCYDDGMYFHTDIGTLFLIRYDDLIGRINDSGIYPLNGNVFFEWEQKRKSGGIDLVEKQLTDYVSIQEGVLTHVGSPVCHYLHGSVLIDCQTDYNVSDRIFFNPWEGRMIESPFHLSIFDGKEIYTIRRYEILAYVEQTE